MSETAEVIDKPEVKVTEPSEGLLSKRRRRLLSDPMNDDNPITIQVLGICSALAVTTQLAPTSIMAVSVVFVIVFSNLIISMMRNLVPGRVRIIVQLAVIATLVTLVDQVLKAYFFDIWKSLTVFVGLIITNCIVMGRLEAFAMGNKPYDSILDGLGSGFGYAWIILVVAFFRELLGAGSLFGFKIFEAVGIDNFPTNGLMVTAVGAFVILGLLIWIQRSVTGHVER